jgi:hemolysin activation/secretion protein
MNLDVLKSITAMLPKSCDILSFTRPAIALWMPHRHFLYHRLPFVTCLILLILSILSFFPSAIVIAAERPDAGRIMEGIKDDPRMFQGPERPAIRIEPEAKPPLTELPSRKIMAGRFRITGNTIFNENELLPLISDRIGKEQTLPELEKAAAIITAYYQKKGYIVARAYIPAK